METFIEVEKMTNDWTDTGKACSSLGELADYNVIWTILSQCWVELLYNKGFFPVGTVIAKKAVGISINSWY